MAITHQQLRARIFTLNAERGVKWGLDYLAYLEKDTAPDLLWVYSCGAEMLLRRQLPERAQSLQQPLTVGTWVQIVTSDQYAGMIGPIDWIDCHRAADDNNPYGVDLAEPGDSLFFAADELCVLPGKPEDDPRVTRLVVLDDGTEFLLVATNEEELAASEQELREADAALCA